MREEEAPLCLHGASEELHVLLDTELSVLLLDLVPRPAVVMGLSRSTEGISLWHSRPVPQTPDSSRRLGAPGLYAVTLQLNNTAQLPPLPNNRRASS